MCLKTKWRSISICRGCMDPTRGNERLRVEAAAATTAVDAIASRKQGAIASARRVEWKEATKHYKHRICLATSVVPWLKAQRAN